MPTQSTERGTLHERVVVDAEVARWPGIVALGAIAATYFLVSEDRTFGPTWLLPSVLCLTVVAALVAGYQGAYRVRHWLVMGANTVVTASLAVGTGLLIYQLSSRGDNPLVLLRDAVLLWILNVIAFALWYWEVDNGGPIRRSRSQYQASDFLFPQVQRNPAAAWTPGFVDYLFLAFNTSTAFSPTDTLVLSRPAKLLMMLQSSIALVDVVVIAARAVGTLQN